MSGKVPKPADLDRAMTAAAAALPGCKIVLFAVYVNPRTDSTETLIASQLTPKVCAPLFEAALAGAVAAAECVS